VSRYPNLKWATSSANSNNCLKLEGLANFLWEHVSNLFSQSNCFPIDSTQNCQLCSSKLVVKVDPQLCQPVLTDKVENLRTTFCHQLYSDKAGNFFKTKLGGQFWPASFVLDKEGPQASWINYVRIGSTGTMLRVQHDTPLSFGVWRNDTLCRITHLHSSIVLVHRGLHYHMTVVECPRSMQVLGRAVMFSPMIGFKFHVYTKYY
jgi:hypothetical protein